MKEQALTAIPQDQKQNPRRQNPGAGFWRMLSWLAPFWPIVLVGFICMVGATFLLQQPPRIVGIAVDEVIAKGDYHRTIPLMLALLAVFVLMALFSFVRTYSQNVAGQKLLHAMRVRMFRHYQTQPLNFFDSRHTGDLMSRATGDVEQIERFLEHGLDMMLMGFLGMGLALYYIIDIHPLLALGAIAPLPFTLLGIIFFSRIIRPIYRTIRDRMGSLNSRLQEYLSGIRVIKAFNREPYAEERITERSAELLTTCLRGMRLWSTFIPGMMLIAGIGSVLMLGVGLHLVQQGDLRPGQLVACWLYVQNFYVPINGLFIFFNSVQRCLAAGDRICEILDTEPQIRDPKAPAPFTEIRGQVAFDGVTFRYATGEEVLKGINFTARPGERVALVGRSGAGKSSFINLIPRFYDVADGRVLIDGVDVRDVRQADLRGQIAMVLQETFLFSGTVRENLRFGRLDATDEEIAEAAKIANAHEFIERLPDGYDTEIGERGVKLSGGQKQRLAIARAVLANPRILILDEATSSVDTESEFLIHQAFERLIEGRTTFIIAHRLSTIRNADTILVLENGEIVEQGTHDALIDDDGLYAQMYRQQFWLDELVGEEAPAERRPPQDHAMRGGSEMEEMA
ncbi:MAG: ABC transporter ATP-binding protein [Armatimonadota bacterium]